MQQRLAHQVEIEKAHLAAHFVGEQVKLLCGQLSLLALVLRTEVAVEVAGVGYFYVTAVYHCGEAVYLYGDE